MAVKLGIGWAGRPASRRTAWPAAISVICAAAAATTQAGTTRPGPPSIAPGQTRAIDLPPGDPVTRAAVYEFHGDIAASEGVMGLRRAFRIAGAGTVLMSLWSVDDVSARRFMTALYEARLEEHLSTAEAMRHAALRLLQENRRAHESTHPYYWGAFLAAGDWRAPR